jgi:hypothetical protein
MTTTPFTTFAYAPTRGASIPTGATTRTTPERFGDIINVKDFGALGDFSHDDSSAIQAALAVSSANNTIFFPPGGYKCGTAINIGVGSGGRIIGSGDGATFIFGDLPNGFVFYQNDGDNGPSEIGHLGISNTSTNVGTGALRISNSSAHIHNCGFRGMILVLLPFNIYDMIIERCGGVSNQNVTNGTGYNGTLGIAGYAPHVFGCRSTGPFQTFFQLWGSNGAALIGNGIENCECCMLLGALTGWASHCTVSGDILTVGGTLGTNEATFGYGAQVYCSGLPLKTWGSDPMADISVGTGTYIIANGTGTGGAGTYQLNTGGHSITTPVPAWCRVTRSIGCYVASLQNEGCHYGVYLNSVGGGMITAAGGNCATGEAVTQDGNTGWNPHSGFYIRGASSTVISNCFGSNNCVGGAFYFDPVQPTSGLTLISCSAAASAADVTMTASISNGSGGAGTILNVTATSSNGLAIGMPVIGTGVTAGTFISGSTATDGTLTGYNSTGTYRVNNSQSVASRTMTSPYGPDYMLPTSTEGFAGLKFISCTSSLGGGRTTSLVLANVFNALPGQAGGSPYVILLEGFEYDITDGAKSGGGSALFGDIVVGGGSQHIKVRYNGTNWTRSG